MCVGCMAMYAAVFAGANAQGATPAPAPIVIVQKPTPAQVVRAAFNENRVTIKTNLKQRVI